jgi:toxin ParE1/3/4
VPTVRYSQLAESDLYDIGDYTLRTWGADQAVAYLEQLENRCLQLADHPAAGRPCDSIRPGLRRYEEGRHVIFFRQSETGVIVSRILHQRMLPDNHSIE